MYEPHEISRITADFEPLIRHYARKCGGEEMRAELWAFLWQLVAKGQAINRRYVAVAIRNKFTDYVRLLQRRSIAEQPHEWWENADEWQNFEPTVLVEDLLQQLTYRQRRAVELCELYGFSAAEVAQMDGCSRQAVNRLRKDGLDKLKRLL